MKVSTDRNFLDFDAKYHDEATYVSFDGAPHEVIAGIATAASRACRSLGVNGISRVDLRLDDQHVAWLLEVNTLPGFTPHSAVPTAASQIGIGFDDLCERALAMALAQRGMHRAA